MTVDSDSLLTLARELRDSSAEVRRRASTSRLCYGMLHRSIECLSEGVVRRERPRGGSTFRWVRARFIEQTGEYRVMLNALSRLKQHREEADYDVDLFDWPIEAVERAETLAREVARLLDEYVVPAGSQPALGLIEPAP